MDGSATDKTPGNFKMHAEVPKPVSFVVTLQPELGRKVTEVVTLLINLDVNYCSLISNN